MTIQKFLLLLPKQQEQEINTLTTSVTRMKGAIHETA